MKKRFIATLGCVLVLLMCICAIIACQECKHEYVDGVCTKCGEPDPDYIKPNIDVDMSGVKFQDKTVSFNGQAQTLTVTGTLPSGIQVTYEYYSDAERTKKVTEIVKPGTYYVTAVFTAREGYNKPADMKATLTVTKGTYDLSAIKFENTIELYTGEAVAMTVQGTLPAGLTVSYQYYSDADCTVKVDASDVVNAGTYYVIASFTEAEGYNKPADMKATLTITKLPLAGISFVDKAVTYTGEAQSHSITGTLPNGLTVIYEYYSDEQYANKVEASAVINAGVYYVKAIVSGSDAYDPETLTAKLTVNKADVTGVTLDDAEADYDGEAKSVSLTGTLPSGVTAVIKYYSDNAYANEVTAENVKNAGVYYVKAIFTVNANYNAVTDKTATLTVKKADVASFTFADKQVDYTGEAHEAYVFDSALLPEGVTGVTHKYYSDDKLENEVQPSAMINAGDYYVKAIFTVDGNHNAVKDKIATFTINKIAFDDLSADDVTFDIKAKYDEQTVNSVYENEAYTFGFNPGRVYQIVASAKAAGKDLTPTFQYFTGKEDNGSLTGNIGELTKPTVTNYTDVMYVQATFEDDNHTFSTYATVKMTPYTVTMNSFGDLKLMRDHIYGNEENHIQALNAANRKGIRYVLGQDIDCNNEIWTPVVYLLDLSKGVTGYGESSFCSEFDGNGHTISNFRITEESFDADAINALDPGVRILHVGFFGRVNAGIMYNGATKTDIELEREACNIHDVTFDNMSIKLDAKIDNYKFEPNTAVYAGFVAGYLDSGNQHTVGRTNLYNITVQNSTIDIDAYKSYVGGIIGYEDVYTYAGLRNNLKVDNSAIYAISSKGTQSTKVYIGGLVGRYVGGWANGTISGNVSETPDREVCTITPGWNVIGTLCSRYNNCTVSNIKLGYNYEALSQFDGEVTAANEELNAANEAVTAAQGKVTAAQTAVDEATAALEAATTEEERTQAQAALDKANEDLTAANAELTQAQTKHDEAMDKIAAVRAKQAPYLHVMGGNIYVGLFAGSVENFVLSFKECVAQNYLIAHTSPSAFYSGYIARTGDNTAYYIHNTSTDGRAIDGDWNNGIHGIYGVPNDQGVVTQQTINWENATEANKYQNSGYELSATVLDRKENTAKEYLGLN